MKLYKEKIPYIAKDIIAKLCDEDDIFCESREEAQLDAESVLKEYVRMSNEITDLAKDRLTQAKLPYGNLGRIKKMMADERGFSFGDEGIRYMSTQLVELFLQSNNIDEIFSEDYVLRNKIEEVMNSYMNIDSTIDAEVKKRLKNLEVGTMTYDIEYKEMEKRIKAKYGLE